MASEVAPILTCKEAKVLLKTHRSLPQHVNYTKCHISLDLGLSLVEVIVSRSGVALPNGTRIPWDEVEKVARHCQACFAISGGKARPIRIYSELTSRVVALMPTDGAPTLTLSGIAMHRIRGTEPWRDTESKLRALGRVHGNVLDVCTGLGYTAIQAARHAAMVVTLELDPAVLAVARQNPWSQPLFTSPNLYPVVGDALDLLPGMPDGFFHQIIHDPPLFGLAGDLYSADFYRELHRVLKLGGRLFHYVGNPESKMSGNVTRSVLRRLQEAGFRRVTRKPRAFGVLAVK